MLREFVPPAGVRVVRVLARSARIERLLVHIDDGDDSIPAEVVRASGVAGAAEIRRSISALDRLQATGIGGLIDAFDDGGSPAALLSYQRGTALADLLASRTRWQAGEAVAVLAPVSEHLQRMHDAGVAHGAFSDGCVTVTFDGAAIAGFGSAELFAPHAPEVVRQAIGAVGRDREGLRELASEVLLRVGGSRAAAAHELRSGVQSAPPAELTRVLRIGLDQLAAALPIALEAPTDENEVEVGPVEDAVIPTPEPAPAGSIARFLAQIAGDALTSRLSQVAERVRTVIAAMPTGRRRMVVGGGAAVAVASVLLAAIPAPDRAANDPVTEVSESPTAGSAPESDGDDPGTEDDPAHAAVALLELRESCFRELSLLCLDGVDQIGSAALATDRDTIFRLREGGEVSPVTVDAADPRIIERLGDSALVEVGDETAPASLLMMRSEAGWRIRDWIAVG